MSNTSNNGHIDPIDSLDFTDLAPIELPVKIMGRNFLLREASADAAVRYRNCLLRSTRMVDGKVSGIEGMADAEPLLVSCCLLELIIHSNGETLKRAVTEGDVRRLPNRITAKLFEAAKRISRLDEDEKPEVIKKQIKALQERLEKMEPKGEEEKQDINGKKEAPDPLDLKLLPSTGTDG